MSSSKIRIPLPLRFIPEEQAHQWAQDWRFGSFYGLAGNVVAEKRQVKRNTRQAKQNFNSCCALSLLTEPHARLYLFYFKSIESLYLDLWMWLPRHFIWQQLHQSNQVSTWAINNIWGLFSYMLAKAEEHQWTKLKLVTSLKFESFFFLVGWFCNSRALYKGILQPGKSDLPPNYVTDQCEVKNKNNKKKVISSKIW